MICKTMIATLAGVGLVLADDAAEWQRLFSGESPSGWTVPADKVDAGEIPTGERPNPEGRVRVAAPYASMSSVKGISTGEAKIRLSNPGKIPVSLAMKLMGKDAASFRIERIDLSPPLEVIQEDAHTATFRTDDDGNLGGGKDIFYRVRFLPAGKAGRYSAGLQIGSEGNGTFVVLQGVATDALEGENEPPLLRIVEAMGIPLDVGGPKLTHSTEAATVGANKPAENFRKAGEGPVRLTPVARYSPPGDYVFGWQADGTNHEAGSLADSKKVLDAHQRVFPPLTDGGSSVEFSPGDEAFGLFIKAGKRTIGTDVRAFPSPLKNPTRIYPVSVFQGTPIKDALLVCFEEANNGDYQDSVFLMENVRIAE